MKDATRTMLLLLTGLISIGWGLVMLIAAGFIGGWSGASLRAALLSGIGLIALLGGPLCLFLGSFFGATRPATGKAFFLLLVGSLAFCAMVFSDFANGMRHNPAIDPSSAAYLAGLFCTTIVVTGCTVCIGIEWKHLRAKQRSQ